MPLDHLLPGSRALSAGPAIRLALCTLGAALTLALSGCAAPPEPAAEPPAAPPAAAPQPAPEPDMDKPDPDTAAAGPSAPGEALDAPKPERTASVSLPRQMLQYADRVRGLSPPELTAEIARLSDAQSGSGAAPETAFQLSLALLQTRQPADTARSLGLLQKLLADGRPAAVLLQPLARLVENRLLQQRRLEDQADRQGQQIRDMQRRIDQLNERLEAMRAIERSLNARPGAPGNGRSHPASADTPR
ncbi:hypothetical protein [Acidovorax sp. PRC11]|uniref:hypothetical protein n=1 Tax=Acidovorax sp. PRC11 TaxID=2962592 RepID=UPI0028824792|nr:hypothetical protein [Acidovorax sp. PRC11]MDT0137547.1 hypothetical protein [Acidovorax sp. PRC11]